jgi:hypothetical protein
MIGYRITEKSVVAFDTKYMSLSRIAKLVDTTSRSLMQDCQKLSIRMVLVCYRNGKAAQRFVRMADGQRYDFGKLIHLIL